MTFPNTAFNNVVGSAHGTVLDSDSAVFTRGDMNHD